MKKRKQQKKQFKKQLYKDLSKFFGDLVKLTYAGVILSGIMQQEFTFMWLMVISSGAVFFMSLIALNFYKLSKES